MKVAQLANGQPAEATQNAPPEAKCPYCGGTVLLRRRRLMNDQGFSYFWRHQDNMNRRCPARLRPVDN